MKGLAIVVLLAVLTTHAFCCSCPPDSWFRPRNESIRDAFCDSRDVFLGTVVAVTCSCIPPAPPSDINCQSYSLEDRKLTSEETLVIGQYIVDCSPPFFLSTCSDVASHITPEGYTVENTTSTPQLHNITDCYTTICPFDEPMDSGWWYYSTDMLPCLYTIRIDTAFKGSFEVGENITSAGPDVLTSCGYPGNLLVLGTQYLQGIGGVCSPIPDWVQQENLRQSDWDYLRELSAQYMEDTSACSDPITPSPASSPTPSPVDSPTPSPSPPMSSAVSAQVSTSCPGVPSPTFTPKLNFNGGAPSTLVPSSVLSILSGLLAAMLIRG